jgi:hypothetical protein
MKTISSFILFLLLVTFAPELSAQPAKSHAASTVKAAVQVMYFHGERRCYTCTAIETVAKQTVESHYEKDTRVEFLSINHEEKNNAALVRKYKIAGSSLVVQGPDDEFKDFTRQAFQFSTRDPGKLQSLLVSTINGYLK